MKTKMYYPVSGVAARKCLMLSTRSVFAGAIMFSATEAKADLPSWLDSLYVKGYGGFGFVLDGTISQAGAAGEASYEPGQLFGAAIGKKFSSNLALEIEFFYRSAEIDKIATGGPFAGDVNGDFASTNLMLNAIYTFTKPEGEALWGKLSPYLGLGVGFLQEADIDLEIGGAEQEFDDNYIFATQIFAGISYELHSSWSVFAETRYHYAGSIDLDSSTGTSSLQADYDGVSFLAGLRYNF